jgi:tripeptidyl-peptidase-2
MMHRRVLFAGFAFVAVLLWLAAGRVRADKPPEPSRNGLAAPAPAKEFPTQGLLPKEEIGALRFLAKNPQFDGRDVVVAIFDSGVDPGAPGLQTTSDGKPKIIDMIDGTGSGDVDTATVREPKQNVVEGLTGRKLKLDPSWVKPGRKFHLGMKRAYDFFPDELVPRLRRERRKTFDEKQRACETALRRQLADFDAKHPKPDAPQKLHRADLDARLKQLLTLERQYDDPGPIFDCVVFHNGQAWQAVVDTDEDGDLAEEKLLTNYRDCRKYGTFGGGAQLNFGVNIYDEGRTLSLVADCNPHGTHVSGIVAGHFPKQPELCGIAPGAQIVVVKIGDSRLGSMETGAGLIRGLSAVVRNKCDLVNMSYGEPSSRHNAGRLCELLAEVVHKHGVIFVSSAGNAGPALSTVGAPGGTTAGILGVGAYVSPAMMEAGYTLRQRLGEMPYTWTSRGPTMDGDPGVSVFAPGGAIAPVPNWTLQPSMLMNGTSMASPNCCGGVALLLSGLKASKVKYSPYSVRRALENTARPIATGDPFTQGAGLIQVDRAFDQLSKFASAAGELLRFDVNVAAHGSVRGIYLRERHATRRPTTTNVSVRPVFAENAKNEEKLSFEMRIALRATQPWVEVGEHLVLTHGGKTFEVQVDPTELPEGAHFAEIQGFDAHYPARGPLFRVPITVILPDKVEDQGGLEFADIVPFRPGSVARQFLAVPRGATWMDVSLICRAKSPRRFMLHTVQCRDGMSFRETEQKEMLSLEPEKEIVRSAAVTGGRTLELCLAQFWSSLGESVIDYRVKFRGLAPDRHEVTLTPDEPLARVEVTALTGEETFSPSARLDTLRRVVPPAEAVIRPMSEERDRLPDGRVEHELVLTYRFEKSEPGGVTPRFPLNDQLLYDSDFGTQLWLLFDSGKRRVATGDVFPKPVQVAKGPHVLKFQLRHSEVERLERLKEMPLLLEQPLASPITLGVFSSRPAAVADGVRVATRSLHADEQAVLYVKAPAPGQVPGGLPGGEVVVGTITYGKAATGQSGAGDRPGGYPLRFVVPPKPTEAPSKSAPAVGGASAPKDPKAKIDPLPALVDKLHRCDAEEKREERLSQIVAAADAVITQIDTTKLAQHLGTNPPADDESAAAERKRMEQMRDTLCDALYRKGRALGYMELPEVVAKTPIADKAAHDKAFEATFAELRRWADTTDAKHYLLHVRRDRRAGRAGLALELLNRHLANAVPNAERLEKRAELYGELGWKHWEEYERRWLLLRFPKEYERF